MIKIEKIIFPVVGAYGIYKGIRIINSENGEMFKNIFVEPWKGIFIVIIGVVMLFAAFGKKQ